MFSVALFKGPDRSIPTPGDFYELHWVNIHGGSKYQEQNTQFDSSV